MNATLDKPTEFLKWISQNPVSFDFANLRVAEIWSLVALSTLARKNGAPSLDVQMNQSSSSGRFAHAVGFEDVLDGMPPIAPGIEGRTVKLSRLKNIVEIEKTASKISKLISPDDGQTETKDTIYYVLVELLRNALQHSQDKLGAVVAAQLGNKGRNKKCPVIQVAVADAGIGIQRSISGKHPEVQEAKTALDRALWPSFSGTFEEGESGSQTNAGMGLFFIAEMAKRLAGTLLISSRGATLSLRGDPNFNGHHELRFLNGVEFPGTLVAFEIPENSVEELKGLFEVIKQTAEERTPRREIHRWFTFENPSEELLGERRIIRVAAEDTNKAFELSEEFQKRLFERKPLVLDFSNLQILTQSYLHALLYESLRLAWARKVPIYIINVSPAIRSTLELLQNYALGG
ncbi:MAG: hypothetical protein LBM75_02380 [Myxococcales bacterium]|nr:hypothetical protein [Myxococcales bacterium]